MGSKRRRATSPSSSVSGGDFEDSQPAPTSSSSRKRRRTANIPTVDPVSSSVLCWFSSCKEEMKDCRTFRLFYELVTESRRIYVGPFNDSNKKTF